MKQLQIGNVVPKNNLVLAPMAGVTTTVFRKICKDFGAGLVYAEMVSDKGLTYHNEKSFKMIEVDRDEHPIAMQLFGSNSKTIVEAAKLIVSKSNVDIIDLNMGCPVNKVVKSGAGAALLKNMELIYEIVSELKAAINIPITVKIRAGWDFQSINCHKVAKIVEKAGANAIAIHGRTRSQLYTGNANLDYIKMVKDSVKIPVIGNGDVVDIKSALKMFNETGVDGIMIGRSALGNPWIFKRINNYFNTGEIIEYPQKEEVIDILLLHAKELVKIKGEHIAMIEMRTHAIWYLKQIPMTKQYRAKIVSVKTYQELEQICYAILNRVY